MNKGTKIRTLLVIAVSIHTALLGTDITGFSNPKIDLAYKVASIIVNFIVVALSTYYNNDYTEAAAQGTAITRQIKEEHKADYVGDFFFVDDGEVVNDVEGGEDE